MTLRVFYDANTLFDELFNRVIYESNFYGIFNKVSLLIINMMLRSRNSHLKDDLANSTQKTIAILKIWTESFPYDFRDDNLAKKFKALTKKCKEMNERLDNEILTLKTNLYFNVRFYTSSNRNGVYSELAARLLTVQQRSLIWFIL